MERGKRLTVNSKQSTVDGKRLTANGKQLTVLVISLVLLISFVTVAIATGFFGTNTTKISSLEKGLVAHYPLDGVYQTKDVTPYSNHGTNYGATLTTGVKGEPNGAYSFGGVNDYIRSSSNSNIIGDAEFTMSGWVYWDGSFSTNWPSAFGVNSNTGNRGLGVTLKEGRPALDFWDNRLRANNPIEKNTWTHIAVTKTPGYISTTSKIYVNGILQAGSVEGSNTIPDIINAPFVIGRLDSTRWWKGSIQDVRIYNRALSEDEIQLLFDSYKPKEASVGNLNKGLILDMPLTTKYMKSDTIVADRTPYGNDGAVTGATVGVDSTSFDGNDYIDLGRPEVQNFIPQVDEFSISVWYKSTKTGVIYSFGGSTSIRQIQIDFTDVNIELYLGQNIGNQNKISTELTPNYKDGKWHHVAIVIPASSTGGKFYYDGNLVSSSLNIGGGIAANNAYIGARTDGTGYPLTGAVSNLKIWNRLLSDEEVKLLYEKSKGSE